MSVHARTGAALLLVVAACAGPLAEHPASGVAKSLPANLEAVRPRDGEPRTVKLRIYADPAVRALPHWKDDITEQIDYANQLLQPLLGVKLASDAIADWDRPADGDPLRALAELDRGDGVTWVVGYIAPLDRASTVMDDLGAAQPLGHHVVVRGWAERAELAALAGRIPAADAPARVEVIGAHRRHKQTVVLLHQLAVTLGAIAEADPAWIQHAAYSTKQSSFADRTRDVLQRAIDGRIAGATDLALARELADAIERQEWGGWVASSREQVLASLRNVVEAARAGRTAADVPPEALTAFNRIGDLAKHGRAPDALAELANLLIAYPGNATMHQLRCEIMLGAPGVGDPATRAACARVAELAPGDPRVHLAVGEALVRAHDLTGARAELAQAEQKIANLPTGAVETWRRLIGIYQGIGALTWTDDAIEKAQLASDPIAAKTAQTRARFGIPRGARFVRPEDEAALVAAIRQTLDHVYASKFDLAERALAAAEKRWPGAPGLMAARCDLAFRRGQLEVAQATCGRAIAADPDASWALYLHGVLLLRDAGTTPTGVARLKRAIAVDPDLAQAWRTLGKAYTRSRDRAAFEELSKAYAAKFGQALPP